MPKNKLIIGLVGEMSGGKGTAAQYLKEEYKSDCFRYSSILRDVLDRLYLDQSRKNLQKLSSTLRQNFGEDLFAKIMLQDVQNSPKKVVCIDGIRRFADIELLQPLPGFKLVHITASSETRYKRMLRRGENVGEIKKSFEQFKNDELAEADKHVAEVAQQADIKILNEGSKDDLFSEIDAMIKKLQSQMLNWSY